VTAAAVDAVVVGAGPNGLAAAVTLAQAGLSVTVYEAADEIGGGARTRELTLPGLLHDVCSAVHPLAAASKFLASLPLAEHGLEWRYPEIDLAHPLDGGRAGVMLRSVEATEAALGRDGAAWRRAFGPLAADFDDISEDLLAPVLHVPRHPLAMVRFGLRGGMPGALLARTLFRTDEARAMFGGTAAHVMHPLDRPATAAAGVMLTAAAHHAGWPVAAGGSQAITTALARVLASFGGNIETGVQVTSLGQLPPSRLVLLDTSPRALLGIAGDRLAAPIRRAYQRWRYGPAAFKVDLAVQGGIPWTAEPCRRAGTVHLGGTLEEIVAAEAEVHRGRMPQRPFVLVAQQYLCDPQRSRGDVHPVWTYAHVPHGYTGDATAAILDQVERFAPGFRERIVAQHVMSPAALQAYNQNCVGGDIAMGANTLRQVLLRPRIAVDPYATGIPGMYLCSAATPPGAGAHGMCGHYAARRALRWLHSGR
jgi:phytoene dehydrogenase-like protein